VENIRGTWEHMGMGQNLVPLVNIKIAGKWMFIPLKMVLIGMDSIAIYTQCGIEWNKKRNMMYSLSFHGVFLLVFMDFQRSAMASEIIP